MPIDELNQLRANQNRSDARSVLVRGTTAPSRPTDTVTVAPGITAVATPERIRAPLRVIADASSGRTVRQYDGTNAAAAADRVVELAAERDPDAVWLCEREQIRSWWGEGVSETLERRLAGVAREADARLVVWSKNDEAVGDRYDVVLDP